MKPFGGSLTGYSKGSIRMSFPHGRLHVYKVPPSPAAGNAIAALDDRFFDHTLESTGMNHCLAARYIDIDRFIDSLHTERE